VHVVQATALWISPTHLCIEQAFVTGGTLATFLMREGTADPEDGTRRLPPVLAAYFLRQLLSALAFCHARRVVQRDVKLENCLLSAASPPLLQLCDFGVAAPFSKKAPVSMHSLAGTPGFIAPSVAAMVFARGAGGYDGRAADVWSAGAVLCKLLTGELPFGFEAEFRQTLGDTKAALHRSWAAANSAPARAFIPRSVRLSPSCVAALETMLAPDESARPSAADCLLLPWLADTELPAAHAAALARAADAQAAAEAAHAADPPRRLGQSKHAPGEWRYARMRAFVARAAKPGPGEAVESLSLLPQEDSVARSASGEEASLPTPPANPAPNGRGEGSGAQAPDS